MTKLAARRSRTPAARQRPAWVPARLSPWAGLALLALYAAIALAIGRWLLVRRDA
ncbi:MAG TPA: hypothetical protein VF070_25080 [Streptosporangiaceae bacterium]